MSPVSLPPRYPPSSFPSSLHGFGFARGVQFFPHYGSAKFPPGSGEAVVAGHPGAVGLAVRDGAAVIVRGGDAEVIGKADVAVLRRGEGGAVSTTPYHPGEHFPFAEGVTK